MVKIHTVGGFSEVGKNMAVIELDEDAFIIDEGFFLPAIVSMQERDNVMTERKLKNIGAIPEDSVVESIRSKVCAQFISHAHLDHVGAVPFLSDRYEAPIYGTPFTIEVLDSLLKDNDIVLKNKINRIKPNTTFYVQGKNQKYKIDFIHMTHSTVQCSMVAIHTKEGVVLFSGDFKLDDTPVLGPIPNYKRLKEIGKEGVVVFIVNSLYSGTPNKTPSESHARELLRKTLIDIENKHEGMIVTTFASHIARLKSIVEFGKKLDREVVFLGRSLDKYSTAAKNSNLAPFLNSIKIAKYRRQVERTLQKVEKKRKDYLVVCTGHQGEPGSILERLSRHQLPFRITSQDNIIFSSSVIPSPVNIEQFAKMEARLKKSKPKIYRDLHVSGHGREEDLKETIKMVQPKHIIPWHGDLKKTRPMVELMTQFGYRLGKTCHLPQNGEVLEL
ncbi:MAG: MBL fold metallo-hydrolase [Nanoarchaeota archaeon]|nr:MBL fold metallo-hydrolase [Nanoarchaeota archaeon]